MKLGRKRWMRCYKSRSPCHPLVRFGDNSSGSIITKKQQTLARVLFTSQVQRGAQQPVWEKQEPLQPIIACNSSSPAPSAWQIYCHRSLFIVYPFWSLMTGCSEKLPRGHVRISLIPVLKLLACRSASEGLCASSRPVMFGACSGSPPNRCFRLLMGATGPERSSSCLQPINALALPSYIGKILSTKYHANIT